MTEELAAIKDKLKLWQWAAILGAVCFIMGFFVAYQWLKPQVDVDLQVEIEKLKDLNDRLDEEIEELYFRVDTTDAFIERKSSDWREESRAADERNRYTVPQTRDEVITWDADDQLRWWNEKHSNSTDND